MEECDGYTRLPMNRATAMMDLDLQKGILSIFLPSFVPCKKWSALHCLLAREISDAQRKARLIIYIEKKEKKNESMFHK